MTDEAIISSLQVRLIIEYNGRQLLERSVSGSGSLFFWRDSDETGVYGDSDETCILYGCISYREAL